MLIILEHINHKILFFQTIITYRPLNYYSKHVAKLDFTLYLELLKLSNLSVEIKL